MRKAYVAGLYLTLGTAGPILATPQQPAAPAKPAAKPATDRPAPAKPAAGGPDLTVLHVQVLLDRLGFGPGVIDGKPGATLKLALRGFQEAKGVPVTGEIDQPTLEALHPYRAIRPVRALAVAESDLAGPFVGPLPSDPAKQAGLPTLGYADPLEKLAEKFHTTPATITAMNPNAKLAPGAVLSFPNVLPASRDYDPKLKPEWRQTLNDLNVSADQPRGDHVVVDKSDGVLRVMDKDDKVIAQFPATMGSAHDPLPIGTWKIQGASYNPPFHFNPDLFWDAKSTDKKTLLPPGPNGPVGVVWLDLSKEHYGIHGTPNPEKIGRTESHGCIRLTNWDAARLSLMVRPGTTAVFQE